MLVMKKKKIIIISITLITIIVLSGVSTYFGLRPFLPQYELIKMEKFPIPLYYQFSMHNITRQEEILNQTRFGSQFDSFDLLFFPYPTYFHGYHYPATFKWGMPSNEYMPIIIPIDCYMEIYMIEEGDIIDINDDDFMVNIRVHFHISPYIIMEIGHMDPNVTLIDEYNESKERIWGRNTNAYGIFIPAGTMVGYTNPPGSEIRILDTEHRNYDTDFTGMTSKNWIYSANPWFYFTETVQHELQNYYQIQYDAMKESGGYPISRLNRTFDINEEGTFFGTWFYKDGPLILNDTHHYTYDYYSFDGGILDILNVNKTNQETFYKDVFTGENFTNDMIGVFDDGDAFDVDGYDLIDRRYMYQLEGDFIAGIINLTESWSSNIPVYMKFQLNTKSDSTVNDDILVVEYFSTYSAAQGSFTNDKFTYIRLWEY
jgi:hypothetical protein